MSINRQISYQNGGYCVNLRIVRIQLLNKWVRILPGAVGEFILPCGFEVSGRWRASHIDANLTRLTVLAPKIEPYTTDSRFFALLYVLIVAGTVECEDAITGWIGAASL